MLPVLFAQNRLGLQSFCWAALIAVDGMRVWYPRLGVELRGVS